MTLGSTRVATGVPSGFAAARLALLALRAAQPEDAPPTTYRLGADGRVLGAEEAAHELAALPKPLAVAGEARDGAIDVRCRPLAEDPDGAALHRARLEGSPPGETFDFLRSRRGEPVEDLGLVCRGRGEYAAVRVRDFAEWERDYAMRVPLSWGAHRAGRRDRRAGSGVPPEVLAGAAAVVSFGVPGGIRSWMVRELAGGPAPALCERCAERAAALEVTESDDAGTRVRLLCGRCWRAEERARDRELFGPLWRRYARLATPLAILAAAAAAVWLLAFR